MYPVSNFDEICGAILENYEYDETVTIGILVADWRQDEAKQYIINYMDRFDKKSGKYIDFYIPGYYEKSRAINAEISKKYHPNSCVNLNNISVEPAFYISRKNTPYFFERVLFENFIEEMESRMMVEYTYNPMLLLVEVNKKKGRGSIEFQNKLVIELDEDSNRGLRRTGNLFDKIFEVAKKEVNLDRFGAGVRMYYIKGKAVKNIVNVLNGEWLEALTDVTGDVVRCRIKSHN